MEHHSYGHVRTIEGTDLATARERVVAALKEEGFGVLTEIDIKATFKKKLDADFMPYTILGACNPKLAHHAISSENSIGLLLPCNVVLYEATPGEVTVEAVDPRAMFELVENDEIGGVAQQVSDMLERAIAAA